MNLHRYIDCMGVSTPHILFLLICIFMLSLVLYCPALAEVMEINQCYGGQNNHLVTEDLMC